jgi:predicted PurR-regulated permease PerM
MSDAAAAAPPPQLEEEPEQPLTRASGRSILLGLIAAAVFLYAIRRILLPFVLAGAVAYALAPAIDWIGRRARLGRTLAAILVFFLILAVMAALAAVVGPQAGEETRHAVAEFPALVTQLVGEITSGHPVKLLGQQMAPPELADRIVASVRGFALQGGRAFLLVGWAFSILFGSLLTLVLLFYFLISGPSIGGGLFRLVPPAQRPVCEHIWRLSSPILRRYLIGIAGVVVYASAAAYLGLGLFLGLPNAILLSILTGLLEMIPVIGPLAAAVIAGLAAVQHSTGLSGIVAYVLYATALRLSIDQLVGPVVLGQAARVHPALVIFCFLSGGILFGITGLIMAVPVALLLKVTLAVLYEDPKSLAQLARSS